MAEVTNRTGRHPAGTDAVRDIIIKPMCELYLPPPHLRQNALALTRALAAYEKTLASFDPDTLQRAWQKIISEHKLWRLSS